MSTNAKILASMQETTETSIPAGKDGVGLVMDPHCFFKVSSF